MGLQPGTRNLGLRFPQASVAEDSATRALRNHEGKKSNKKRVEGPRVGPAEAQEQGRKNEGVRGWKGKETTVDGETVFSIIRLFAGGRGLPLERRG